MLPYSAELWSGSRDFDQYAGDLREFAASGYGRRRFRLLGLRSDGIVASSCKRYERDLRCGDRTLRAVGLGAVFTRDEFRGRGFATALLAALLDAERSAGTDIAFLFSDIRPHFYAELGFTALPSRAFTLRADSLEFERIEPFPIGESDWPAVARCFAALDKQRPFSLARTPLFWESVRAVHRKRDENGLSCNLAVRSGRGIGAYVLGRRIVKADSFVVDEFAYASPAHRSLIGPLLRAAAGDLAKISGWLPPELARSVLPRGSVRARRDAILMVAPLSTIARERWGALSPNILRSAADAVWSADHV